MLWQAAADLRFRMPEGYVIDPAARFDPASRGSALFRRMAKIQGGGNVEPLTAAERSDMLCTLLELRVRSVVVGPMRTGGTQMIDLYRDLLGADHSSIGGVELWPNASGPARRGAGSCS
jgi:hypothetical protein